SAGWAPASSRNRAVTSGFSRCTTRSLRSSPGHPLSTWSRNEVVVERGAPLRPALRALDPLVAIPVLAAGLLGTAVGLVFFLAPKDADQGISQKIFYIHVPCALTAYACFAWGAWKAYLHLWKRSPDADVQSYVAIHQGV